MKVVASILMLGLFVNVSAQELVIDRQVFCRAKAGEKIHRLRTFAADTASVEQISSKIKVITLSGRSSGNAVPVDASLKLKAKALEEKARNQGLSVSCSPNYVYFHARTSNDPQSLWGMTKIGAPAAWDRSTGSRSVKVAVIDTGVQYTHPDLASNIYSNSAEIPGNGVDDDGSGFIDDVRGYDFVNNDADPADDNGHGSHCAGTIGAQGNDGVGVTGVNWEVSILPVKVLSAAGSGSLASVAAGVDYASRMGADVLSMSLGGAGDSTALRDALQAASNAGRVLVFAAGNSSQNVDTTPSYPAAYQFANSITVAATDSNDLRAYFSSYGLTKVHVAAPGVGILSTIPNNAYASYNGTSMATPHVAGLAALLKANNAALSGTQIKQCILGSVDVLPSLLGLISTGGRINAGRALSNCGPGGQVPAEPTATPTPPASGEPTPPPSTDPGDDNPEEPTAELEMQIVSAKKVSATTLQFMVEGDLFIAGETPESDLGLSDEVIAVRCRLKSRVGSFSAEYSSQTDGQGYFGDRVRLKSPKLSRLRRGDVVRVSCTAANDGVAEEVKDSAKIKF